MICRNILLTAGLVLVCALAVQAGCPFDDGSCQEYCNQQGCNLGYCGHFAWIQCICRKCGDEWNWYDKVHYNPDKQVNQTELDSLKLNVSGPIILTNNNNNKALTGGQQQQQQAIVAPSASVEGKQQEQMPAPANKQAATLTTLLIPDLSDGSKLDLNDIPDENSEKFLDYLAKNHEKLAQATNAAKTPVATSPDDESDNDDDGEPIAEETVEIQISSSDNQQQQPQPQPQPAQPQQQSRHQQQAASRQPNQQQQLQQAARDDDEDDDTNGQQQRATGSQMTRLLKMAVAARSSDDIF